MIGENRAAFPPSSHTLSKNESMIGWKSLDVRHMQLSMNIWITCKIHGLWKHCFGSFKVIFLACTIVQTLEFDWTQKVKIRHLRVRKNVGDRLYDSGVCNIIPKTEVQPGSEEAQCKRRMCSKTRRARAVAAEHSLNLFSFTELIGPVNADCIATENIQAARYPFISFAAAVVLAAVFIKLSWKRCRFTPVKSDTDYGLPAVKIHEKGIIGSEVQAPMLRSKDHRTPQEKAELIAWARRMSERFPDIQTPRAPNPSWASSFDSGLFTPLESLDHVKDSEFSILKHPFFPRHSVRVKKSSLCDPTVRGYTGYIDIEARHLFFYFFESRSDPDRDDVIFWTNGGKRLSSCPKRVVVISKQDPAVHPLLDFLWSSVRGFSFRIRKVSPKNYLEIPGPCRVLDDNGPKYHPESWNTNANIFFVDQPVNVGFSYAEHGETVSTTEEAAKDIAAFVAIFFENFSKFKGRAFHMSGESYGGRYVPLFASAVYDQNTRLVEAGMTPINLKSVIIGNGMTDWETMLPSYYDMACTPASVAPILDISTCVAMKNIIPRCNKMVRDSCVDQFDAINCAAAASFCQGMISDPFVASGTSVSSMNPYDISVPCNGSVATTLCYPITNHISKFLSDHSVRKTLGVDAAVTANFTSCSNEVSAAFGSTLDILHSSKLYVGGLLERNVKVLIYVGSYDWICNWVGNERWTLALEWSGQKEFVSQTLREWTVDGVKAGVTRSAKGGLLTFATVQGAGHMVPYNKPKQALTLVQRWLAGEPL
ncbi:hypothetical protein D9757_009524 [Collybiopsis confluens]|uniref:Carboxypeptidase n=1 Tax=Collybiopsis confluens TaxID=2823264 RepID=A0A8H5H8F7_9AGAR|nr:hypothetical protein D9757_009524 [Collybiopsis confluens]